MYTCFIITKLHFLHINIICTFVSYFQVELIKCPYSTSQCQPSTAAFTLIQIMLCFVLGSSLCTFYIYVNKQIKHVGRDCERQPTFTGPKKTFCSLSIGIFLKFGTDSVFSIFKVYLPITCTDKWRFQRVMSTLRFVDVLFDTTRESCTTR